MGAVVGESGRGLLFRFSLSTAMPIKRTLETRTVYLPNDAPSGALRKARRTAMRSIASSRYLGTGQKAERQAQEIMILGFLVRRSHYVGQPSG